MNDIGVAILDTDAAGNVLRRNTIRSAPTGILILTGEDTLIEDNDILDATDGIIVQSTGGNPPLGTIIGDVVPGDLDPAENRISGSDGDAIRVVGSGLDGTRIGVNLGVGNAGEDNLFIDLVGENGPGNGPSGPSGALEAPSALVATTTQVTVTAEPDAVVYLYRRDGLGPRLDAFLGRVEADGSGKAILPVDLAPGTALAATQETSAGTSELRLGGVPPPPGDGGGTTPPPRRHPHPAARRWRHAAPARPAGEGRGARHHRGPARRGRAAQPRPRARRDPPRTPAGDPAARPRRRQRDGGDRAGRAQLRRARGPDDDPPRDGQASRRRGPRA